MRINRTFLPNTLIDLGASIDEINVDTMTLLQLKETIPTLIALELTDKSIIKPIDIREDVVVTIASWEYLIDLIVISLKTTKLRHPIVLFQPCLNTFDVVIDCINGETNISNGSEIQSPIIFPPPNYLKKCLLGWKILMGKNTTCFLC